jgi:hypothetical protein|nr:MAG TPA: hypothetical protein [Caudoviricetes sp.]
MALQRYEENPNNYENFREKQEIICKFSGLSRRMSCIFPVEIIQIIALFDKNHTDNGSIP